VIIKDNIIYMMQDNLVTIELKPKAPNGQNLKLCLQGMNCVSFIQRSEVDGDDMKRLKNIDIVDKICSICLERA
jgi:hypothetical protein